MPPHDERVAYLSDTLRAKAFLEDCPFGTPVRLLTARLNNELNP
jgi:hypothetical protein